MPAFPRPCKAYGRNIRPVWSEKKRRVINRVKYLLRHMRLHAAPKPFTLNLAYSTLGRKMNPSYVNRGNPISKPSTKDSNIDPVNLTGIF